MKKPVFSSLHGKKGRAEYHLTECVLKVAVKVCISRMPVIYDTHLFYKNPYPELVPCFLGFWQCSQQHICTAVAGCVKIFEQNFTLNVEAVCHSRDFLFSFKIIVLKCSHGH